MDNYYNGLTFMVLAKMCNTGITLFSQVKSLVLTKVIAEIWEHSDIITVKSDGARNMSNQMIRQVANKPVVFNQRLKSEIREREGNAIRNRLQQTLSI